MTLRDALVIRLEHLRWNRRPDVLSDFRGILESG